MKQTTTVKVLAFILTLVLAGCMYSNASPSLRTSPGLETVKPTYNFYLWANRQWLVKTDIPADNPRADNFTQIEDVVAAQLRELFVDIKGLNSASYACK